MGKKKKKKRKPQEFIPYPVLPVISQPQPEPQPQTMEVHKHPHHVTHKKNWGEYILEFLMIFLAVFLGFIAENRRENIADKRKEKEFMISLLSDLNADTSNFRKNNQNRLETLNYSDSLINLLVDPARHEHSRLIYYYGRLASFRQPFFPSERTFEQLKSTGNLRLIRPQIADSIVSYYWQISRLMRQLEFEENEKRAYRAILEDLFDVRIFLTIDTPKVHQPVGNPKLLTNDDAIINKFCMRLHLCQTQSNYIRKDLNPIMLQKSESLISLIQKEYHLE